MGEVVGARLVDDVAETLEYRSIACIYFGVPNRLFGPLENLVLFCRLVFVQ